MGSISISYQSYSYFMYTWIAIAVLIFFLLLKVTAPYGRHASGKWGPMISNRLGWLLMEFPVMIIIAVLVIPFMHTVSLPVWVMLGLFFLHYINRTFVFPFRLHTRGKKMPVLIVASGIFFNLNSGFSLGYYFSHFAVYSNEWFYDIRFIAGTILFFTGLYINWRSDDILIGLRKPEETHYVIPVKGMFRYISCPNLFGEMLEWLGFAILCWNLPALGFFIWTAANLIPRALSHHRWYRNKFPEYPANRKAIIPYII